MDNKKLLSLDESLSLSKEKVRELYRAHVNAGLLEIYDILGLGDLDIESAEGVYIKLSDGRSILDFTSALGILALGHNHHRIIAAEKKCAEGNLINAIKVAPHKLQAALAYNLSSLLPHPLEVCFFSTSGAEAVEAALKLCEKVQGERRRKFISLGNSYHGKTHATLGLSRSGHYRDGFIQGIPEENILEVPYNNIEALTDILEKCGKDLTAAIVEPMQGQGLDLPGEQYLQNVVKLCHKHGVLVIFDEVKVGMSRTGTFCAFQSVNVVPDVVTISKSLGGGSRAIGAMITSRELFSKAYGEKKTSGLHTTTFGGLGYTCASAIETLNIVGDPTFQRNVKAKGEYLKKKLEILKEKYPDKIKTIKGKGLLQGIEFNFRKIFKNSNFQIPDNPLIPTFNTAMMASLVRTLFEKYFILTHFADSDTEVLHIMPPLIVEEEHLDAFVSSIDDILARGLILTAFDFLVSNIKDRLS